MNKNEFDNLAQALTRAYKETYQWEDDTKMDWDEVEIEEEYVKSRPKVNYENLLREVMHELHRQGEGMDTLLALKNDRLRDWWSVELAKIKKEEAKVAAREKAKSLLSEEERKLLGMKF